MVYNILWNSSKVTIEEVSSGKIKRVRLIFWKRRNSKKEEWVHKYTITIPLWVLNAMGKFKKN